MDIAAYARRRAIAIAKISEVTGVELGNIRGSSQEITSLLQLEALAENVMSPAPKARVDQIMDVVDSVDGVGQTMGARIRKALEENYGD